jgi:hypothetical protein
MRHPFLLLAGSTLIGAGSLLGQNANLPPGRFSFSYHPMFNVGVKVEQSAVVAGAGAVPSVNGVTYGDGYVATDSSGNAGGETWNWGYQNPGQITPNALVLSTRPAGTISDEDADVGHGFEMAFGRIVGGSGNMLWGIEGALGFTHLGQESSGGTIAGYAGVAAPLNGITPPSAPYAGTFAGPGPLIGDTLNPATLSVASDFEAGLVGLKLGPFLEWHLGQRWHLNAGVGVALAVVNANTVYTETVSSALGVSSSSVTDTDTRARLGGYASVALAYEFTPTTSLFAGATLQSYQKFKMDTGDKRLSLDLGLPITFNLGVQFTF